MTTAGQMDVVNRKLAGGDGGGGGSAGIAAVAMAEGGLVQGWMKARRLVVVVASADAGNAAVFVFSAKNFPVAEEADLDAETVLPVDPELKCEIDAGDAVLVKLSGGRDTKLMFEMLPGFHTQNLVAEIFRLKDAAEKAGEMDFSWTKKYATGPASGAFDYCPNCQKVNNYVLVCGLC